MGRGRYLVFYLVGGLVAMLAQVVASPHSTIPNLGASGAIAAVMGAFIVTYPRDQIRTLLFIFLFARIRFIPATLLIGLWFISQLFHAGAVAHVQTGGGAYFSHIGGFFFRAAPSRLFPGPPPISAIDYIFNIGGSFLFRPTLSLCSPHTRSHLLRGTT